MRNAQIIKKCRSDFWFWATNFVQYNKDLKCYGKYRDYNVGDTVYTVTEEKTPFQPLVMECVVEEKIGAIYYKVYDVTQNIMYVRSASQLISLEDMEYSVTEWMKIKFKKDGNK